MNDEEIQKTINKKIEELGWYGELKYYQDKVGNVYELTTDLEKYLTLEIAQSNLKLKNIQDDNKKQKEVLDKIKNNNKRIIDYGFDYDGFNNVEDLKKLIDMLVDYARKNNELLELEEIE